MSARRVVENEALALTMARSAGAAAPEPLAVARTDQDAAVLATEWVEGTPVDQLDADVTQDQLEELWGHVATLQRHRIAHRSLQPTNVVVDDRGSPVLVGFRRSELDASDEVLGADVAELLAALAVQVGTERAVASAAARLAPGDLARALPLLQLPVLSPRTRTALKRAGTSLEEIRAAAAAAAGTEDVDLVQVKRITLRGAVSLLGSIVLVGFVVNLVANWAQTWDALSSANALMVLPILVLVAIGFGSGALSLQGAVTVELPFWRTTQVMFAQSFLNRFTPANAGGMAMRMRYLQLQGVDAPSAATSVGLTSLVSGIVQGALIVVFFVWGGTSDRLGDFSLPDFGSIVVIGVGIGAAVGLVMISGWGRRTILPWIRSTSATIQHTLTDLVRDPGKLAQLFGGAVIGKLSNIVSFWLALGAFDVDMSFAKAGALFMIANTLGSAVPTPGGVGGIEAAMTAVLVSFGVDNATAAAVVLFYRFLTYWVPTVPGYVFMRWVQRRGIV